MHGRSSSQHSSSKRCFGASKHVTLLPLNLDTDRSTTGFPTSYGIFQAYYSSLPDFASNSQKIAVIGTLAQGLYYLGAPFAAALTKRFPQYRKHQILLGWPLCILGLLCASFANSVPALIATQGLLYGLGFVILTYPILQMVSEWWITRRGMAFGLISAASGVTGIFMPLLLEALLHKYGYRITLRACAIAMAILTAPLVPLLKGRVPTAQEVQPSRTNWSFLQSPLFWFYAMATIIQGFGFFFPPVFVASYAIGVGLSSTQAAALLAVMATAQTLGQFVLGWLSDQKLHVSLLTSVCCVVAAVATATLWGFGKSLSLLLVFSMLYGFFAFGFSTLRVAMGRAVSTDQTAILATYSTFVFLQGIGNVMVGPLAAGLMHGGFEVDDYGAGRYRGVVVFVAATSMLGAVVIMAPHTLNWGANMMRRLKNVLGSGEGEY